jgi:G3E family GTPase
VNKLDLATPEALAETGLALDRHAPGTLRLRSVQADIPMAVLFGLDRVGSEVPAWETDHAGLHVSWLREDPAPMSRADVAAMAADLVARAVRAKGHVWLSEAPDQRHLYQQVGRRWTLTPDGNWGTDRAATRIVAIAIAAQGDRAFHDRRPAERAPQDRQTQPI